MTAHAARFALGGIAVGLIGEEVREIRSANRDPAHGLRQPGHGGQLTFGEGPSFRIDLYGDSVLSSIEPGSVAWLLGEAIAQMGYAVQIDDRASDGKRAEHLRQQIAVLHRPDLVLMCVGGNDAIHPRPLWPFEHRLENAIGDIRRGHPDVPIILIGAPDLSTVPRFGPLLSWQFGHRARAVNRMTARVATRRQVHFAHLAQEIGWFFRDHPETAFAEDRYHPSVHGNEIIARALIERHLPAACPNLTSPIAA